MMPSIRPREFLLSRCRDFVLAVAVAVAALVAPSAAMAQITSSGNDFIVGFLTNDVGVNNLAVELHLTSPVSMQVQVEYPVGTNLGAPLNLTPGNVHFVSLPSAAANGWVVGTTQPNAVRLSSLDPTKGFTAYMVNRASATSDAALALPIVSLATFYRIITATPMQHHGERSGSQFVVVATEDATTVTITPALTLSTGQPANLPFDVVLDRGQGWLALGGNGGDLTGSTVQSDRPVSVSNGNGCVNIDCGFCDHVFEVAQPERTWGTSIPVANLPGFVANGVRYRIMAAENATTILEDGVSIGILDAGQFITTARQTGDHVFAGDQAGTPKPLFVVQLMPGCATGICEDGDPSIGNMIPSAQYLSNYTFSTLGGNQFQCHFLSIIAANADVGALTLDDAAVPAGSFSAIGASGFSAARISVSTGVHRTASVSPHGITVEGYNSDDSYLYPAGAALNFINVDLQITKNDGVATCVSAEDPITYAICYQNTGDDPASNVVIVDTLPPEVTFVSASGGGVHAPGPATVTWNVSTAPASMPSPVCFDLTVTVNAGTPPNTEIVNRATMDSDGADPVTALERTFVCGNPPQCDANGPYVVTSQGATTSVPMQNLSSDPDGDWLTFHWSSDCPGAELTPSATASAPVLRITTAGVCQVDCSVSLTANDGRGGQSSCGSSVSVTVSCDDGNACTIDSVCDPQTALCEHSPMTCDDNDPCTVDTCDASDGCVFIPNDEICNGIDDDCDGTVDNFATYCGVGGCFAFGTCTDGVDSCTPGSPSPETCNGLDDDCDGFTDDDLGSTTCGIGACENTVENCVGGAPRSCEPNPASPESCNGIDDDCDGTVDGFATSCGVGECVAAGTCTAGVDSCIPGSPSPEACNGIDDDCDGTVDAFATSCGLGVCVATGTCTDGVDSCTPGSPSPEICNGIDDDCNGSTDDGLGQTTCGVGACQTTVDNCVDGVPQTCVPGTPSAETCNGIDDDCDGTVDDFATSCGLGVCIATGTCTAGVDSCIPGSPSPETCNGIDDDCNGSTDEGQTTCGVGACQTTVDNCVDGVPQACIPGTPSPETCNGIDDNCDGTVDGFATSCGAGECAAVGTCTDGVNSCTPGTPSPETCNGLDDDCDGAVDNSPASPAWTAEGDQDAALFGYSVASAGDVNNDGFDDVIVGAFGYDNDQINEGRAVLYLGSASGLDANPAWTAEGDQDYALFGISVASAGDVNGDGFGDVIVGANGYDNDQIDEGRAFLYLGSASGLAPSPAWTADGDQESAAFGTSVASAGDVNDDGFGDVIVAANGYDNDQIDEGRAFLYLGSASGLAPSPAWTAEGDQDGAAFGGSVASAGDVNGDGFGDVIVGANGHDNGQIDEGRAFLYLGSATGLAATPAWTAEGDQDGALFGYTLASAGDVNDDGFSDVIVGALGYDNDQIDEGRAFVYLGSASGLATTPAWTAEGDQDGAVFGSSVSTAGDVNGDGFSDVIVGGYGYDNDQIDEGRAFVYLGSASGLATAPAWAAEGDQESALFGFSVGTAGDANGDGFSDVVGGAFFHSNDQIYEGRAFVYLGSPGLGTFGQTTCGVGACQRTVGNCVNGAPQTCAPGTPAPETCNGIDDDCNSVLDDALAPAGSPALREARSGSDTLLSWTAMPDAQSYDVVRGNLGILRGMGGNFTPAVDACEADGIAATSRSVSGSPSSGNGFFFLVRGVNCGGPGTYDTGATRQVGSRDTEVNASVLACP